MQNPNKGFINTSGDGIYRLELTQPLNLDWEPKEDITTYELALCLPFLIRGLINIMPDEFDKDSIYAKHFKIS